MTLAPGHTEARRPAGAGAGAPAGGAPERAFCRAILPRVSRTFSLNIRLLGGSMGEAVRIAYLLCRIADTIEDAWPGSRPEVESRFDQLLAALAGDGAASRALAGEATRLHGLASEAHIELLSRTPEVLRAFATLEEGDRVHVVEAVTALATGMRRFAGRAAERRDACPAPAGDGVARFAYIDDDGELTDYCWIVAGCIGLMLSRLFARRAAAGALDGRREALSPAVGEGLQLTNILLDWSSDLRSGRCHVPASWLAEHGLAPRDLVGAARPEVRTLARRLEARAIERLAIVAEYLRTIPSRHARYRMFCLWPSLWAAASLRNARRDEGFPWGPSRPRLPKDELWRIAVASLARGHTAAGVDALFRELGIEPVHGGR